MTRTHIQHIHISNILFQLLPSENCQCQPQQQPPCSAAAAHVRDWIWANEYYFRLFRLLAQCGCNAAKGKQNNWHPDKQTKTFGSTVWISSLLLTSEWEKIKRNSTVFAKFFAAKCAREVLLWKVAIWLGNILERSLCGAGTAEKRCWSHWSHISKRWERAGSKHSCCTIASLFYGHRPKSQYDRLPTCNSPSLWVILLVQNCLQNVVSWYQDVSGIIPYFHKACLSKLKRGRSCIGV